MRSEQHSNIILIGPMGSGKTTVGRALARKLGLEFFDADEVLLAEAGCTMEALLEQWGEAEFRQRETRILQSILIQKPLVFATGGGVVLKAENRDWLRSRGFIVYLAPTLSTQLARLSGNHDRPFLEVPDRAERLRELNEKRLPHYEELANLKIDVDDKSIDSILSEIIIKGDDDGEGRQD
jgi:shikimate kinase